MPRTPQPPLSRDRAWSCISLNFTLSGLGSYRAGRIVAGVGQLGLVFAGFFLLIIWILDVVYHIFQWQMGQSVSINAPDWLWKWGAICFVLSYAWMLITCLSLFRQAKAHEQRVHQNVPPKLADVPGKNQPTDNQNND